MGFSMGASIPFAIFLSTAGFYTPPEKWLTLLLRSLPEFDDIRAIGNFDLEQRVVDAHAFTHAGEA